MTRRRSDAPVARHPAEQHQLRTRLIISDVAALLIGFAVTLVTVGYLETHGVVRYAGVVALASGVGLWALRSQGLLHARINAVRTVEISRLARAVALDAGVVVLADRIVQFDIRLTYVAWASVVSFGLLIVGRTLYRRWLSAARERGLHLREVVLLSTGAEAQRIYELFATNPKLGLRVVGVVGAQDEAEANGFDHLWLGEMRMAETLVLATSASGVVVFPQSIDAERMNELVRIMHAHHVHVHVGTGLTGIAARRMHTVSLAYEPFLYVEQPRLSRLAVISKRVFDVAVACLILLLASPVMIAVALAVKLTDGGPMLFRQERVGRNGRCFRLYKFRSMVVDAEARLAELVRQNERNGPLFKMERDPRVTRIGAFLRLSSLDELPQLYNVLRGDMSLIGPRPALPAEVALFPPELRARELVTPGISGLWQVEARDSASFEAYRRLDLFYVENWSLTLDLVIVVATMEQVVSRVFTTMFRRRRQQGVLALPVIDEMIADDAEIESAGLDPVA